jgi:hypothetical protein
MNRLDEFLVLSQKELFSKLRQMYRRDAVISVGNYILVPGEAPIMLLAHLDTVHTEKVRDICKSHNGSILMSPQGIGGDDRCGVYGLVKLYSSASEKPWLLFTCDEETGGDGASTFCKHFRKGKLPKELKDLKMLVELDRQGENDAVYYECGNEEFAEYITSKGFETAIGSFSDIFYVAPTLGVAAVNLSSGYYNAHTLHEYINRIQLDTVVKKVKEIISDATKPNFPKYEYVKVEYNWGGSTDWGHWALTVPTQKTSGLRAVPPEYAEFYNELLDIYSARELDELRQGYGDRVILTLYESEIGSYLFHDSRKDAPEEQLEGLWGKDEWKSK